MKKIVLKLVFIGMSMSLLGCSNVQIEEYAKNKPLLQIQQYLNGEIYAYGILEDWNGLVTRRFSAKINGTWNGNEGVLEESFIFDDGQTQERTWKVIFSDQNNFIASAGDVVGTAIGKQLGNSLNMQYVLNIPYKSSNINISMDDWMYLLDDNIMINKTKMKKFGITVGNLTIVFIKKSSNEH